MAQHVGTAGRSVSNSPAAFLAGTLFAVATMATVIVLALALGMHVQLRGSATATRAYDGRIDPIENAYIRRAHSGTVAVPRVGVATYDGRLDPIEQAYIDGLQARPRTGPLSVAAGSPSIGRSWPQDGQPQTHLVPR